MASQRCVCFGSWARGQQRPDSDLDLLVGLEPGRLDVIGLEQEGEALVGQPVDVLTEGGMGRHIRDRIIGGSNTSLKEPTLCLRHILDAIGKIEAYTTGQKQRSDDRR